MFTSLRRRALDWTNQGVKLKLIKKPRRLTLNLDQLMRAGQYPVSRIPLTSAEEWRRVPALGEVLNVRGGLNMRA